MARGSVVLFGSVASADFLVPDLLPFTVTDGADLPDFLPFAPDLVVLALSSLSQQHSQRVGLRFRMNSYVHKRAHNHHTQNSVNERICDRGRTACILSHSVLA